jgi:hypothetical protein
MAASTGPDSNLYQIPEVELGDTFNVWRDTTNTQTYKLNKMKVYEGVSSSSIFVSTSDGGTLQAELADNIGKGVTFLNPVVFSSGVTFNGDVTFNASTFTVNANAVTIDDYAIVLGDKSAASDTDIDTAGGGGMYIKRGSGRTAEWIWKPNFVYGVTGVWQSNAHIGINGSTFGIVPHSSGVLPVHGSGIRIDGGGTAEHGLQISLDGTGTTYDRTLSFERYAPTGSTAFIEVYSGSSYGTRPFVNISDGANRKVVKTLTAHGFNVGAVVRFDGTDYVRALANSSENAEVIGIVSKSINSTTFELTFIGEIIGDFSDETDSGGALQAGRTYYLSPYSTGKLTAVQPIASGTVHKAVLIATSSTSAVVLPFTGGVLASPLNIANASSVTTRIFQINRFKKGDVVRFKAYPSGVTLSYSVGAGETLEANYSGGIYVKAQANSSEDAEVAGMVVDLIGATGSGTQAYQSFDVLMDGFFDIAGLSPSLSGDIGSVHFLNTNCAGTSGAFESATASYTTTAPSAQGQVRKPLFMATGAGSGYLFSYRGDVRGAVVGVTAADLLEFLVKDIRSGISGDLKIGVYDTTIGGKETITISTGYAYDTATVGSCGGYVGIGGGWSAWNTGYSNQSRILLPLDVNGAMRLGKTLAATPAGQDLIVLRGTGDAAQGVTAVSKVVIGTEYSTANLVIGTGVRPNSTAAGYRSSISGSQDRSALVLGVSGSSPVLRWSIADNSNVGVGSAVGLNEVFVVHGNTAEFRHSVNIGTTFDRASVQSHKPRLFIQADSSNNARPQIYMTGTDGNFLLMNASGAAGDYNSINQYAGNSYLVFGKSGGGGAGHTFAIAPWAVGGQQVGMLMSYNGTSVNVGINTYTPESPLHIRATSSNTSGLLITNGAGGDDQTAGGCMGLRIKAGDGSGNATLLDVQNSTGTTTHFAVRKDGMTLNGRAFTGGFFPQIIAAIDFGGNGDATITVPGTSDQRWVGILLRTTYNLSQGDGFVSSFIRNATAGAGDGTNAPALVGGSTGIINQDGVIGGTISGTWVRAARIWWWRVA